MDTDVNSADSTDPEHPHGLRQQHIPGASTGLQVPAWTTDIPTAISGNLNHGHQHCLQWQHEPQTLTLPTAAALTIDIDMNLWHQHDLAWEQEQQTSAHPLL